jgi:ABC-type Mn2+/Zn2+ transport system permease subunit
VFVGLVASYYLDWPSGATIILVGTLFFVLASIAKSLISSACKSSAKLKNN